jgi:hypothetical protein
MEKGYIIKKENVGRRASVSSILLEADETVNNSTHLISG